MFLIFTFRNLHTVYRVTIPFLFICLYFWLHWGFVAVRRLLVVVASLVAEHGLEGARARRCTGSKVHGLEGAWAQVAHGLSCSVVCGIFPDQEFNVSPVHWQMDSYPLYLQESP